MGWEVHPIGRIASSLAEDSQDNYELLHPRHLDDMGARIQPSNFESHSLEEEG